MKKDNLKSLVTQMYEELLNNIDSQEKASKEQIIHYLEDAIDTIRRIDNNAIDSIEHARIAFTNAYKEIAKKSISSYKATNEKFEKLEKMHQSALEEVQDKLIDLPSITNKFNEIQTHMAKEIEKANSVITELNMQIKSLEKDSNLDGLTKIFNRRALDRYLKKVIQKGSLKHELHLLMVDVDDFKNINDTYGHIVGDKVLIFIANLLKKTLRDGDKVFRYGGEEFIIILNRITTDKCIEIAQRILKTISTNTLLYKGKSINITVSIGATKYVDGDSIQELIARADQALYNSKKQGKNQLNMEVKHGH